MGSSAVHSLIKNEWDKVRIPVLEALEHQNKDYIFVEATEKETKNCYVDPFWYEWAEVTKDVKKKLDDIHADVTITCVDRGVMDALERRLRKMREREEMRNEGAIN